MPAPGTRSKTGTITTCLSYYNTFTWYFVVAVELPTNTNKQVFVCFMKESLHVESSNTLCSWYSTLHSGRMQTNNHLQTKCWSTDSIACAIKRIIITYPHACTQINILFLYISSFLLTFKKSHHTGCFGGI